MSEKNPDLAQNQESAEIVKSFPVLSTRDVSQILVKKDSVFVQNSIITIDFGQKNSFTDPSEAIFCLEVISSDGNVGTLSHLQVNADPQSFVSALHNFYSKPVSIILSGGETGDADSERLVEGIYDELKSQGFRVSKDIEHSSLFGEKLRRKATVYRDKVILQVLPSEKIGTNIQLNFP